MDVICQAMAAEMHSWGASAVGTYLSWKEVVSHVCLPCLNHLSYFPKFVHEHWWSDIGEGK